MLTKTDEFSFLAVISNNSAIQNILKLVIKISSQGLTTINENNKLSNGEAQRKIGAKIVTAM